MYNDKKLAHDILEEMFEKIEYDKFLDMFSDKFNWFAFLGVSEEDYQDLSLKVNLEREPSAKQKVLTR